MSLPQSMSPSLRPDLSIHPPWFQGPGVSVVLIEVEVSVLLLRAFEQGGVLEAIAQAERAVMMEVIIDEHVIGGCLLAGCLQCGMRIKQRLGHQPARIGNSPHADSAIVVRKTL